MVQEIKDITIIGGGPTGLFALFYAGMRSVSAQIIDALPDAGGQLTALYPEKYIFDVAGIPQVLAKDFVRSLVEQAGRFQQPIHLMHRVTGLEQDGKEFVLVTDRDRFPTRSIIIAAGIGAFAPRRLPQRCAELYTFHELHDIECRNGNDRFSHVLLRDVKAKTTREVEVDVVLPMLGFVSNMGVIRDWGLTLEKNDIIVNSMMETGRPGIYA